MATITEQDRFIEVPSVDKDKKPIIVTIEKDPNKGPGRVVDTKPDPSREKKS